MIQGINIFDIAGIPEGFQVLLYSLWIIVILSIFIDKKIDLKVIIIPEVSKKQKRFLLKVVLPIFTLFLFCFSFPFFGKNIGEINIIGERIEGDMISFSLTNTGNKGIFLVDRIGFNILYEQQTIHYYNGPRIFFDIDFGSGIKKDDGLTVFGQDRIVKLTPGESESFNGKIHAGALHIISDFSIEYLELPSGKRKIKKSNYIYEIDWDYTSEKWTMKTKKYNKEGLINELGEIISNKLFSEDRLGVLISVFKNSDSQDSIELILMLFDKMILEPSSDKNYISNFYGIIEILSRFNNKESYNRMLTALDVFSRPEYESDGIKTSILEGIEEYGDIELAPKLIHYFNEEERTAFQVQLNRTLKQITGEDFGDIIINEYSSEFSQDENFILSLIDGFVNDTSEEIIEGVNISEREKQDIVSKNSKVMNSWRQWGSKNYGEIY